MWATEGFQDLEVGPPLVWPVSFFGKEVGTSSAAPVMELSVESRVPDAPLVWVFRGMLPPHAVSVVVATVMGSGRMGGGE